MLQFERRREPHCLPEFRYLQHSHLISSVCSGANMPESIECRNRAQWSIEPLPTSRSIGSVVHEQERLPAGQGCDRALDSCHCCRGLSFPAQLRILVGTVRVNDIADAETPSPLWRSYLIWRPPEITHHKQAASRLRHTEIRRVQYLLPVLVTEALELLEPSAVSLPPPHMKNVLYDDPPWPKHLCESDDFECRLAAAFGPAPCSLGTGMARALGRSEQKVDGAHSLPNLPRKEFLAFRFIELSRRKIIPVGFCGQRPRINSGNDPSACPLRPIAASPGAGEKVECLQTTSLPEGSQGVVGVPCTASPSTRCDSSGLTFFSRQVGLGLNNSFIVAILCVPTPKARALVRCVHRDASGRCQDRG